jgi:hypothetical protein
MVDPPQYSPSHLICSKEFDEVEDLAVGFGRVQVTIKSWTCAIFTKAWANLQVHNAASLWHMDRLLVESSQRFGSFVSGSFDQEEFPEFLDAIFKHVSDPSQTLYAFVVQECVTNFHVLSTNERILALIQKHGLLGRLLIERLAASPDFAHMAPANNIQAVIPFAPAPESSMDTSIVDTLQTQLTEAQNDAAVKTEMVDAQEQEIARLKTIVSRQERDIDGYMREIGSLKSQSKSIADQLAHKTNVLDKVEADCDALEHEMAQLKAQVQRTTAVNAELAEEINQKRLGQRGNTDFMLELNESRGKTEALSEEVKKLKAQLAAKDDASAHNGEFKRSVQGFGALGSAMNFITTGTGANTAPPTTPVAAPIQSQEEAALHDQITSNSMMAVSSTPTFIEKMRARTAAAGLRGGEVGNTPLHRSSSSISLAESTASSSTTGGALGAPRKPTGPHSKPGDLFSKSLGPHSLRPQANSFNGGAAVIHSVTVHSRTASQVDDKKDQLIRELEQKIKNLTAKVNANGNDDKQAQRLREFEEKVKQVRDKVKAAGDAADVKEKHLQEQEKQIKLLEAKVNTGGGYELEKKLLNEQQGQIQKLTAQVNAGGRADEKARIVEQEKQIKLLNNKANFLQRQLDDARNGKLNTSADSPHMSLTITGPVSRVQNSPNGDRRLKALLKALEEQAIDHKACNECFIDFNCQWRGIVDNLEDTNLVLMCTKCGTEKCRWNC